MSYTSLSCRSLVGGCGFLFSLTYVFAYFVLSTVYMPILCYVACKIPTRIAMSDLHGVCVLVTHADILSLPQNLQIFT